MACSVMAKLNIALKCLTRVLIVFTDKPFFFAHVSYFLSHVASMSENAMSRCPLNLMKEEYETLNIPEYLTLPSFFKFVMYDKKYSPTVFFLLCFDFAVSSSVVAVKSFPAIFLSSTAFCISQIFSLMTIHILSRLGHCGLGALFLKSHSSSFIDIPRLTYFFLPSLHIRIINGFSPFARVLHL